MNEEFENNSGENTEETKFGGENAENIGNIEEVEDDVEKSEDGKENEDNSIAKAEAADIDGACINLKPKKGWKKELLEWVESLLIAVVAALVIVNFVFSMVRVDGQSMEPTLHHRDFLFVWRLGYNPQKGDIVVFKPVGDPQKYYIKRVVATEGQKVDIMDGNVYVDNELIEEDYIQGKTYNMLGGEFPQTVPEGCVFVLGDNREHSRDSRDPTGVGMVKKSSIVGRAMFRLFPFNAIGSL